MYPPGAALGPVSATSRAFADTVRVRILGVDPGLRLTGYGCVEMHGDSALLIEAGVIRLKTGTPLADRLVELDADLADIVARLQPDSAAVEGLFSHYKRPSTAVAMAHARGVILLALKRAGLPISEHRPTRVKKSLTGFGHASKRQMQEAVAAQMRLSAPPEPPDVADAIAVALCAGRSAGARR